MVTLKVLSKYVYAAMVSWVPLNQHAYYEAEETTKARYERIADDYAIVALDPNEPPLFKGDEDRARAQTALTMASFGSYESFFNAEVEDGRKRGDHGTAYCLMQVRPILGIFLDGTKYGWVALQKKGWRAENADRILRGPDLLTDHRVCFTVALHMLRTDGIYGYTGEAKGGRKAEARLNRAKNWMAKHPFKSEDDVTDDDGREALNDD